MTSEQLHKANKLNASIKLIEELERETEGFKKKVFSGALPTSATRYLSTDSDLTYEVLSLIRDRAAEKKAELQKQLGEL